LASIDERLATDDLRDRFRVDRWRFDTPLLDVYDGWDVRLDRPVHLRLLKPVVRRAPGAAERFLTAARSAAGVAHPNLVAVYDSGSIGGRVCIVTEAPARRLRECGDQLAPSELQRLATDYRSGLQAAHEAQLLHGAIDDTALMVDEDGTGKIADVGLYPTVAPAGAAPSIQGDLRALAAELRKRSDGTETAIPVATDTPPDPSPTIPTRPDAGTQTMEATPPRVRKERKPRAARKHLPSSAVAWIVAAAMVVGLFVLSWNDHDPPTPGRSDHPTHRSDLPKEIPPD
jgi:serine/threonine protein kinase